MEENSVYPFLLFIALAIILIVTPVSAGAGSGLSESNVVSVPDNASIGIYVLDFNRVDMEAGTVGVDFYLELKSDSPISIDDVELMNGMLSSVSVIRDTPNDKEYRIVAIMTAEPNLSRYPFDSHNLTIRFEPKNKTEREMVLVINPSTSGISEEADLPGWTFTNSNYYTTVNTTYLPGEVPYSRAVFSYGITRDATSTLLKFFLPLMLIVIVSLASLMLKGTSRLGLNASLFLAAVLIHWRVADAIPLVGYATFLDLFMIITYATLVMVLISGILILKFMETKDMARIERTNYWSIRLIPAISIVLYILLFLTLVI
ncbi:MAG: hypothetical protein WC586_12925 [Methanoregula sp.]